FNFGGSVTEEGKRTCPLADRPISEAPRLPSSVTAPQSFLLISRLFYAKTHNTNNSLRRCRATFSSGEGFRSLIRFCAQLPPITNH
ncbi:MAG: hypothetical protein II395_09945, partial [Ruminococcus sp.]|nr:hypothetical protein [Ruminococcus sp.]